MIYGIFVLLPLVTAISQNVIINAYFYNKHHSSRFLWSGDETQIEKCFCACGDYILKKHSYRININNNPCVCGSSI